MKPRKGTTFTVLCFLAAMILGIGAYEANSRVLVGVSLGFLVIAMVRLRKEDPRG